jgi:hypothetical protein
MLQIVSQVELSDFKVFSHEVWRYLGYLDPSRVRQDIQKIFQRVMEIGPPLLEPAACYDIFPIRRVTVSSIEIEGGVSFDSQDLVLRQRGAKELAVSVATAGPGVEEEVEKLIQSRDSALGYMLDVFASAAVDTLAYKVKGIIQDRARSQGYQAITHGVCIGKKCPVYRDCGGTIVHWWSPGYGDWNALENKRIFSIVDGNKIGVRVKESGMMTPRKSYAFTVPLGAEREKSLQKCVEWQKEWIQRSLKAR